MTQRALTDRIDAIDQKLFDAGVAVLHVKAEKDRRYVDRLITEARIELNKLRSRVE